VQSRSQDRPPGILPVSLVFAIIFSAILENIRGCLLIMAASTRYFGVAVWAEPEIDFHSLIDIFETNKKEKAYE